MTNANSITSIAAAIAAQLGEQAPGVRATIWRTVRYKQGVLPVIVIIFTKLGNTRAARARTSAQVGCGCHVPLQCRMVHYPKQRLT